MILLLAMLAGLTSLWVVRGCGWSADPFTIEPGPVPPYANKLNPNTAGWQSLARLPGVGETRAKAIVAYRKRRAADGATAFSGPRDLEAVNGIGPGLAEKISRFLDFGCAASQPAIDAIITDSPVHAW